MKSLGQRASKAATLSGRRVTQGAAIYIRNQAAWVTKMYVATSATTGTSLVQTTPYGVPIPVRKRGAASAWDRKLAMVVSSTLNRATPGDANG